MENTSLLCTFCTEELLQETLNKISESYSISFDTIYILENTECPDSICCTYNVFTDAPLKTGEIPKSTISLHRKKASNTLYTINALNLLVAELNEGHADRNFQVVWEDYRNMILVTAYGKLKKISTKLRGIIKVSELTADA